VKTLTKTSPLTVAKAATLPVTPEQAQKVVLARNIGKYSLVLRQPGEGLSLQPRRVTDDDLGAAFGRRETTIVSSAGPHFVPTTGAR
jgi:pilus assembly protein CpaB